MDKPYQLEDRTLLVLFMRSRSPGCAAWNRLFDETMSDLRFKVDGEELTLEPTLNRLQDADGARRKAVAEALAATFFGATSSAFYHADHQHAVQGQGNFDAGAADIADPCAISPTASSAASWMRLPLPFVCGHPRLSHRYYAMKARWSA